MKIYQAVAATIAVFVAIPAQAASFNFDFVTTSTFFGGPDQNGSGILTTSDVATTFEGQSALAITGISGQINGAAITGLTDLSSLGLPTYYYLTSGPTFLSGTGVRFDTATFKDIAFFAPSANPGTYAVRGNGTIFANVNATSSPVATSAVPEPATWGMMLAGFGMIGFAARRRQNVKTSVANA